MLIFWVVNSLDVGKRIKTLRENFGLSQNELAKRAKIAQSSLSYIEAGNKSPSIETIMFICEGLGITLKEFFDLDNTNDKTLSPELRQLLNTAKSLTSEQLRQLNEFLKVLK